MLPFLKEWSALSSIGMWETTTASGRRCSAWWQARRAPSPMCSSDPPAPARPPLSWRSSSSVSGSRRRLGPGEATSPCCTPLCACSAAIIPRRDTYNGSNYPLEHVYILSIRQTDGHAVRCVETKPHVKRVGVCADQHGGGPVVRAGGWAGHHGFVAVGGILEGEAG
eukprot:9469644-Pyramimonas_sp.AAC.2